MSATTKNSKSDNDKYLRLIVEIGEESLAPIGGVLPQEGTLYSSAFWKGIFSPDYLKKYGDYYYVKQLADTKTGVTLLFQLDKSSPLVPKTNPSGTGPCAASCWINTATIRRLGVPANTTFAEDISWVQFGSSGNTFKQYRFEGFDSEGEGGDTLRAYFIKDISTPIIIKNHVPGSNIATVWCWIRADVIRRLGQPTIGDTLTSIPWVDKGGTTIYDNYTFQGFDATSDGNDSMRAMFVAPISSTLVRTYDDSDESFYWPAVLTDITFNHYDIYPNGAFGIGTSGNQYSIWQVAPQLIQAYHGLTKIVVRDYISASPFTGITTEGLHPTRVYWDLAGQGGHGSVPECLTFGDVVTPECINFGTATVSVPSLTFDATPQTTWIDHIFSDKVSYADGYYFRRTKTAIVPPHQPGVHT